MSFCLVLVGAVCGLYMCLYEAIHEGNIVAPPRHLINSNKFLSNGQLWLIFFLLIFSFYLFNFRIKNSGGLSCIISTCYLVHRSIEYISDYRLLNTTTSATLSGRRKRPKVSIEKQFVGLLSEICDAGHIFLRKQVALDPNGCRSTLDYES